MEINSKIFCNSSDDLIDAGFNFGMKLLSGDVVALHGDLGVGKTTFTKGIAKAFGIEEEITSPTFNILSMYSGSKMLIHIDAYRLSISEELNVIEYVKKPYVVVVEWPGNFHELKITRDVILSIKSGGIRKVEY